MKNYIAILILFNIFCLGQEKSTGNILEDHDRAVEGILSAEIKKQTEIVNKALAKQSNEVLFSQAAYSFLGTLGTVRKYTGGCCSIWGEMKFTLASGVVQQLS